MSAVAAAGDGLTRPPRALELGAAGVIHPPASLPAPCRSESSCSPATGSARRSWPRPRACSPRSATSSSRSSLIGGASIDAHGTALTDEVLDACRGADAVLLAAVGGPKWDTTDPAKPRPEQGLLGLRKGLGLFANLRPVRPSPALLDASPLKRELIEGTDLLVVRELTGGIYFGDRGLDGDTRPRHCVYSEARSSGSRGSAFELGPHGR